jgi:type I restriction enzyme S subunit
VTPQELKNSILQLAIQGKLVEQRPEEGTGEELYQQIQAEKQSLIKEGKIKKEKPLPEITREEIPFDIPENWKWVRLGEISQLLDGKKLNGPSYPYLEAKYLRGKAEAKYLNNGKFITKGTWAILVDGENSGEVFEIKENGYLGSTFKVLYISGSLYSYYVLFFLSVHKAYFRNNKKGAAIPHLNKELFFIMPFPLPPIAEQKRIVAKIEELLPYVERYEKAWNRLEELNKRFPIDLQKSILQMAIQGKLVEQRPEEGTGEELYQQIQAEKQRLIKEGKIKKEKPLPEISEDDIPFDIPESWKWVRLGSLAELITKGSSPSWQGIKYIDEGLLFVTSENVGVEQLLLDTPKYVEKRFNEIQERSILKKGDILTNIVGASIGRTAIYDRDECANINQAVCLIRLVNKRLNGYITKYLNSYVAYKIMMSDKVDTARANISLTNISDFIVPLPPLAEQKRIVAKLEEILPLCEKLKK